MRGQGDIGHYDLLLTKRETVVARLSPAARHAAFPKLYAKPVPIANSADAAREKIDTLSAKAAQLVKENGTLRATITRLTKENQQLMSFPAPLPKRTLSIAEVMAAFSYSLAAAGYCIEGVPFTVEDLKSPRRARKYAYPRHVAMWLCRRLCKGASTPMIAKQFGGRDHTTCMHACNRAPEIMGLNPTLAAVASAVLAAFDKTGASL